MKPKLALTMGDTNGVGPEILVKALSLDEVGQCCLPVVFGDARVFEEARERFAPDCPAAFATVSTEEVVPASTVAVLDGGFEAPPYMPGQLRPEAGRCAVEWVKRATRLAIEGGVDAIVTCPINKEGIHRAGFDYPGHTDLIAEMTGTRVYRMCLFSDTMRIVHITAHESMADAIGMVSKERVVDSVRLGHEALVRLNLARRRIAVAGLNPHAGEAGAFGREEIEEIGPAVEQCKEEGLDCSGPYPADTVFARMRQGDFDLVVSMYHDQGHGPFKLVAMDEGVNVTLGLPIIRTSVDHGTAYDIAGQGRAREDSLCAAIRLAARMSSGKGAS